MVCPSFRGTRAGFEEEPVDTDRREEEFPVLPLKIITVIMTSSPKEIGSVSAAAREAQTRFLRETPQEKQKFLGNGKTPITPSALPLSCLLPNGNNWKARPLIHSHPELLAT